VSVGTRFVSVVIGAPIMVSGSTGVDRILM
jgi:hypothetical protein